MSTLVCVECASPVKSLYTYIAGNHIKATKCENCGQFADKYIEVEGVVVAIDVLLLRPSAIRHIVYNQGFDLPSPNDGDESNGDSTGGTSDKGVLERKVFGVSSLTFRLIVLSVLSDVYFEWVNCEKSPDDLCKLFLRKTPFLFQYVLFVFLCSAETFLAHFAVRKTTKWITKRDLGSCVSTALLIGSYSKFLPLLTHIWNYDAKFMVDIVDYAKYLCMTDIMASALNCGFMWACLPIAANILCSYTLHRMFWRIVYLCLH